MSNYHQTNWRDNAYNTLSSSYSYGYAGGRTDLPATGYDPVYPDLNNSYQQPAKTTPHYSYYTSNGVNQTNYSQAPRYEEYNPEYPGFQNPGSYLHNFTRSSNLITVNSSAFSVKNAASRKNKEKAPSQTRVNSNIVPLIPHKNNSKVLPLISKAAGTSQQVPRIPSKKEASAIKNMPSNARGQMRGRGSTRGGINKPRPPAQQQQSFNPVGPPTRGRPTFQRGGRGGFNQRRRPQQSLYNHESIPCASFEDHDVKLSFKLDMDNIFLFSGPSSVFTPQHSFPVLIEGHIYESIDHFYQIQKVRDLCQSLPSELESTIRDRKGHRTDGKIGFRSSGSKSFSQLARESIRSKGVAKDKVDEWRNSKGLECLQMGFMAKISQSAHMREAIKETGERIMVHAFQGDAVFGAGAHAGGIKNWVEKMKKSGHTTFEIPGVFPLDDETVKKCPIFAEGRNILGVVLMQLRKKLSSGQIEFVDMTTILQNMQSGTVVKKADENDMEVGGGDGFSIGGGSVQPKLGDLHIA